MKNYLRKLMKNLKNLKNKLKNIMLKRQKENSVGWKVYLELLKLLNIFALILFIIMKITVHLKLLERLIGKFTKFPLFPQIQSRHGEPPSRRLSGR